MARTKKAKSDEPPAENVPPAADADDDEAASEPMAHVSSDVLAGSPDIFASGGEKAESSTDAPMATEQAGAEDATEPAADETKLQPAAEEAGTEHEEAVAADAAAIVPTPVTPPPPAEPSPMTPSMAPPAPQHRTAGSTMALGVVLVVLGLFFLVVRTLDVDLTRYGWPLYVIIPGLTLLIVGYLSLGSGALIPGGIVTTAGLVLAYQSATEDWASWAFAWALVAPGGVGLGLFLQGLRNRDVPLMRQGRNLMFVALVIFTVGFVIFETVFNISNFDYGLFGKAALPGLLIVIGVILLARSMQRHRA